MELISTKREEIKQTIKNLIIQKGLRVGDKILSENQLAKLCRVSPLTARRALADMKKDGILRSVKARGTFVNRIPVLQSLKVALVEPIENLNDPIINSNSWHTVLRVHEALIREVGSGGSVATVISPPEDLSSEAIRNLKEYNAVFFIGYSQYSKLIKKLLTETSLPVIVIGEKVDIPNCLNIYTDKQANATTAVSYLAKHGYRKIGFIGMYPRGDNDKFHGYVATLKQWGLPVDETRIVTGIDRQQDGASGASILFNRGLDCDAVFIDTDLKAIDAIEYFRNVGVKIPEDLAIVSHDGLEPYLSAPPYLTSLIINYREIIATAFARLQLAQFNREKASGVIPYFGKIKIGRTATVK